MTTLVLSEPETGAVQRALTSTVEVLETEARNREKRLGLVDVHVEEEREEAALLEGVAQRLAADQSPGPSRAREVSSRYTGARR